jgi:hypothetical protein
MTTTDHDPQIVQALDQLEADLQAILAQWDKPASGGHLQRPRLSVQGRYCRP